MNKQNADGLTEQEFLDQYSKKQYNKPSLTADIAVFWSDDNDRYVLLVKRKNHPFIDCWALPGGFANADESILQTAERELFEETGVRDISLSLVGVYSAPGRDPRGWVVSVAYSAAINANDTGIRAGDDAADAAWFRISRDGDKTVLVHRTREITVAPEELAFDHNQILHDALNKK